VIDLHCHALPGIDDGPADEAEAVQLAAAMAGEGVSVVAATPHLRPDHPRVVPSELAERTKALQERLDSEGIEVRVVTAGEADLLWAIEAADEDLEAVSYGQRGTDLLVETPYGPLPTGFEELVFRLTLKRLRVMLAHPERNPTFQSEPERLAELAARGLLLQVTANSLLRPKRSGSGGLARLLVERGIAHVLASDSHHPEPRDRASLSAGAEAVQELAGPERARWMTQDAPAAVLAGEALPPAPAGKRRRRWFERH
jgi:protein-tyrosine phosphatase